MEAIQFDAANKKLKYSRIEKPKVSDPDDVIINVAFAGICGTDIHITEGEFQCSKDKPITLGHEFSGTVVEVGSDVHRIKIGDKVAVDPNLGCYKCECCRGGNPHFCNNPSPFARSVGISRDGGWAEFCIVPQAHVHILPPAVTLEQGALCEPLSCISHGWDRISPIHFGQRILITGAGIIGNLWTVILHMQGHKKVTISEMNTARLDILKKNYSEYEFVTPIQLEKRKDDVNLHYDIVIDCSGNNKAIEQGFSLLRRGGKLCIFGVAPPDAKISISPFEIFDKELSIIGVVVNPFSFPNALGLAECLGQKYLNYESLGIKKFKLTEYENALKELKQGVISKAIFKI